MSNFRSDWLLELKNKCDIVDIISSYVALTKKGSRYFGCCPFHNEKTASFCVNPEQYYHCFGCGETGDVVKFVMQIESCDFFDATKILADRVNFILPEFSSSEKGAEKKSIKDSMLNCMHDAFVFYYKNLLSEKGQTARDYLKERNISDETIKRYGVGLSLDTDGVIRYLRLKNHTTKTIADCGLSEGSKDAFSSRIIIPIANSLGKVVAFGGRVYVEDTYGPKYKNSTNTMVFDKSRTLYGAHLAKQQKREGKLDEIVLVEGYMDVIALGSHGILNAVASMGTALSDRQAQELFRLCKNVVICYDGDSAGRKATIRGAVALQNVGAEVRIAILPDGFDPDDYIQENGAEQFRALIEQSLGYLDFRLYLLDKNFEIDTPSGRAKYAQEAKKVAEDFSIKEQRDIFLQEAKKRCLVEIGQVVPRLKRQNKERSTKRDNAEILAERCVLHCLLMKKPYAEAVADNFQAEWFSKKEHRELFETILQLAKDNKEINAGAVLDAQSDDETIKEIVNYANSFDEDSADEAASEKFFLDSASRIADRYLDSVIADSASLFDAQSDEDQKKHILAIMVEAQKRKKNTLLKDKKM